MVLSFLELVSSLRQTFLEFEGGFLEVDCAEVARDNGQIGREATSFKREKQQE